MARQQQYTLGRVFVGDRPLEDLTPDEQEAFRRRTVERMGAVFNDYFSRHPDVYVRICDNASAVGTGQDPAMQGAARSRPMDAQEATA